MKKSILILGGMGPQASLRLHELLIEKSIKNGAKEPDEFPMIIHVSIPVPEFIGSDTKFQIALKMVEETCSNLPLDAMASIGIACNTAHLMVPELKLPSERFVSMIEMTAKEISQSGRKNVGLLASPHTIKTKLYGDELAKHKVKVIRPNPEDLERLNSIILATISGGDRSRLKKRLSKIAENLQRQGADCILLGCTELPLLGVDTKLPVFDSLDILASKLLAKHEANRV